MYIKVRPMTGLPEVSLSISKTTKVEDLRVLVEERLSVPIDKQRLFFHGKQLEDGHAMYDYSININDVIQLMVRQDPLQPIKSQSPIKKQDSESKKSSSSSSCVQHSDYYKVGDLVDACHDGSWWEAEVLKITTDDENKEDGFIYHVEFERYKFELPTELHLSQVRPRAFKKLKLTDLKKGDDILVNYNIDEPEERGYWYQSKVECVLSENSKSSLVVALQSLEETLSGCIIKFTDEILQIPSHVKLALREKNKPVNRISAPSCASCNDNPRRKCRECGCLKCGGKQDPDKQLMCDECDKPYHIYCLNPPLEKIPDLEEWFCPDCKNDETEIVRAGEKLKESKKKSKMVCKTTKSTRDWGTGYACAGRKTECTIVSSDHYGPIPGVEVGSQWMYRVQASEAGVHRPPVSGIHGRGNVGAFSIVLSGGYEDDEDNGDTFTYTGAGGRDLSGNKRTAEQSCDQTLTSTNRALALNAKCPISDKGGDAGDKWREGKPLRVIRSYKGKKHSEYAPDEGIRYDGIYKVCKYWKQKGKSGFVVWRYLMKRDDPIPAPWTDEGKERIRKLGLVMQCPPDKEDQKPTDSPASAKKTKGKKRKASAEDDEESESGSNKRRRSEHSYSIDSAVADLIDADTANSKLWDVCKTASSEGHQSFIRSVESEFSCVCCQELLLEPVTTPCSHNACKDCLKMSFKAEVYSCPVCRHDLTSSYKMPVNQKLFDTLQTIFPGYRGTAVKV